MAAFVAARTFTVSHARLGYLGRRVGVRGREVVTWARAVTVLSMFTFKSSAAKRAASCVVAATFVFAGTAAGVGVSAANASVDVGGGGNDSGGSGSGSPGNGVPVYCDSGSMMERIPGTDRRIHDVHHNCTARGTPNWSKESQKKCEYGMLVFRFWGDGNSVFRGGSLSRANLPDPCKSNTTYRFFGEHPTDATNSPGAPWSTRGAGNDATVYQYAPIAANRIPAQSREVYTATADGSRYTTGTKIADLGSGCTVSSRDNIAKTAYQKVLTYPGIPAAQRSEALRKLRYQTISSAMQFMQSRGMGFNDQVSAWWTTYGMKYGTAPGQYRFSYNQAAQDAWALDAWGNRVSDAAFADVFSPLPCSSQYNAMSVVPSETPRPLNAAERGEVKIHGTCYIPIDRVGVKETGSNDYDMNLAVVDSNWNFGERFSTRLSQTPGAGNAAQKFKTGNSEDNRLSDSIDQWLGAGTRDHAVAVWRDQMRSWYAAKAHANATTGMKSPFITGDRKNGDQTLPAPAYSKNANGGKAWGRTQNMDVNDAINQLSARSVCSIEPQTLSVGGVDVQTQTVTPQVGVHMVLNSPDQLYTGGKGREVKYSVAPDTSNPNWVNGVSCVYPDGAQCQAGTFGLLSGTDFVRYSLAEKVTRGEAEKPTKPLPEGAVGVAGGVDASTLSSDGGYRSGSPTSESTSYYKSTAPSASYSGNNDLVFGFLRATPKPFAFKVGVSKASAQVSAETKRITIGRQFVWNMTTNSFDTVEGIEIPVYESIPVPDANVHVRIPAHGDSLYKGFDNTNDGRTADRSTWFSTRTVTSGVMSPKE